MIKSDYKYCKEFLKVNGCNLSLFKEQEFPITTIVMGTMKQDVIILESGLKVVYYLGEKSSDNLGIQRLWYD